MYIAICVIIVTSMLVQLIWCNHLVSNYPNIGRLVFIVQGYNDPLLLVAGHDTLELPWPKPHT